MIISGENISVCLLTYNHENVIESTIRTILDQTVQGFEFVVSDDCSTDGTWEKILQLAASDLRIKPIRTPHNMGMPGNTNYAVSQTTRPYIALLHHDDLYRQDLLEKWAAVMGQYPDIGFVFNSYGVYQSDRIDDHPYRTEKLDGAWFLEKQLLPLWGCPVRGTALIRRSAFLDAGGMREEFELVADVDLWMRLARNHAIGYVADPIITVRHDRPEYYPNIYSYKAWSWKRYRLLCELHGKNREEYYRSIRQAYEMIKYRLKVTMSTIMWLGYAVVRKKTEMVLLSGEGACRYELPGLGLLRQALKFIYTSTLSRST